MESSPMRGILDVDGHGPLSKHLGERIDLINQLSPSHPIHQRVDFGSPGDLGFAMSDYISPAEYRESKFVKAVFGEMAMNDVLFGMLVSGKRRSAYINCYLSTRTFAFQARERFDAILLTVRGVLDRLESYNVEHAVRQRLLSGNDSAHMAAFAAMPGGEVFALNHAAVSLSEGWWKDEPTYQLSPECMARLEQKLDDSWENPVTARWTEMEGDLGGGNVKAAALPKLSGETIIMIRTNHGPQENGNEEAMTILTRRQREIMDWIAEGKTSAEAAIILGISPRTVEKHLEAVFQRLGVENRIAAMRRYLDLKRGA